MANADNAVRTAWRKARTKQSVEVGDTDEGEEESTWTDQLLGTLKSMDPTAFERLSLRLLREAGLTNLQITTASGDEGIDGSGVYRPSLVSFPIYFQCKRYQGSVGPSIVRDFRGAMTGRGENGLIITTGTFTPAAKHEATRDGAPPIDLIDGNDLCDLLKEYTLGVEVTTRTVEDIRILPEFFETI